MIVRFQRPSQESIRISVNSRYIDHNHESSEDLIANIAFGERQSVPYEYYSSETSRLYASKSR